MFYAPGIIAFGVAGLYARGCYARGEPGHVVRAGIWSVAVNLCLNIVLVLLFQKVIMRPGVDLAVGSGEAGLALASSASGITYLALLGAFLHRKRAAQRRGLLVGLGALAAGSAAALLGMWWALDAAAEAVRFLVSLIQGMLASVSGDAAAGYPAGPPWEWLWNVPKIPAAICVGSFAALAVVVRMTDAQQWRSFLRTSLTAAGMGVAANLVLSSLPPEGDAYTIVVQRALAPVILGVGAYWFLAGIVAAPEYARAQATLAAVAPWRGLRRRKKTDGKDTDPSPS
jgi:peptidoglycan biosynthesis protein MviN/MurJ (putative lipid II flippase)